MKLLSKEVFIPEQNGRPVFPGFVAYISADDPILMHCSGWVDASDTYDDFADIISRDNGQTWSAPKMRQQSRAVEAGRIRYLGNAAFLDQDTGQLIVFSCQALYRGNIRIRHNRIQIEINRYDPASATWAEPLLTDMGFEEGIISDFCVPIRTSQGHLLFPAYKPATDAAGNRTHYPGHDWATVGTSLTIIGEYRADGEVRWRAGDTVPCDLEMTCRGLNEPTVAELKDGRLAMICRGDNSVFPDRPGYKWLTFSEDGGQSWCKAAPLPCTDGGALESSSTGSALLRSIKTDKLYWIGNICTEGEHANGNWPRSPLVIAEVQEEPFALKRETITVIDQRGPNDSARVQFSNFRYYQDRETGDVVLFLSRYGERVAKNWKSADYYRYRIAVD